MDFYATDEESSATAVSQKLYSYHTVVYRFIPEQDWTANNIPFEKVACFETKLQKATISRELTLVRIRLIFTLDPFTVCGILLEKAESS